MTEQTQVVDISNGTLPTLSSRAMFWRPKYLAESLCLEHIPFYFWLIEAHQPRLVFQPEITSGTAYFAMCQAVDKLNLDSRCFASLGDRDRSAGVIDDTKIKKYSFDNYREFSTVVDDTVKECIYEIEDQSIDLLVLKQDSSLLREKSFFDVWGKKLSDSAIVMIHGSKSKAIKPLCHKLKESYKTFEFIHGSGMLVVCFGENQPEKIQSLVNHGVNDSGTRVIHDIYSRLGSACSESYWNAHNQKKVNELIAALEVKEVSLNFSVDQKIKLNEELRVSAKNIEKEREEKVSLKENIEIRFDELAKLTTLLQLVEQESTNKEERLGEVESKLEALNKENIKIQNNAEREKSVLSGQYAAFEKEKVIELNSLKSTLKEKEGAISSLYADNALLKNRQGTLEENNKVLEDKNLELHALTSTIKEKEDSITILSGDNALLKGKKSTLDQKNKQLLQENKLLEQDQKSAAQIIETHKKENMLLEGSVQQRFHELAVLTSLMQEKDAELDSLKKTLTEQAAKINKPLKSKLSFKSLHKAHKSKKADKQRLKKSISIIEESELFDASWYKSQYPETVKFKGGAIAHYLIKGAQEGCNPSSKFNAQWYLDAYPDVSEAGVNPLLHYIKFGQSEDREIRDV